MNMKKKVLGWNINQRSGMGNGIPQLVIDELINQDADIIVLTEIYKDDTIEYFWAEMDRAGYAHAITQNTGTNEVAILWRRNMFELLAVDDSVVTKAENNNPNLLLVDLLDEKGQKLTIVGYRIRIVDYDKRAEELKIVVEKANEKKNPVLMITDSNNLRREPIEQRWNLSVMDEILTEKNFERHTPGGQSIFAEKADRGYSYEFAEDHIITRKIKEVVLGRYDRDFVYRDKAAYPWGKDFQIYGEKNGSRLSIQLGFPDHAIIKGYITLR